MPLKITTKQGQATTTVQATSHGNPVSEQHEQQPIGPENVFQGPACEVGIEMSLTLNLGNYNSTRLGVSLKLPCLHQEIDAVYAWGKQWAEARMNELAAEAQQLAEV